MSLLASFRRVRRLTVSCKNLTSAEQRAVMAKNFPRTPVETSTKSPQRDGDDNRMNTIIHKPLENRNWRELYKVAIRELDAAKLPDRIAEAKRVLVQRARELFQRTGDNLEEEQAVDAAMCTLHVLHSTLKAPSIAAETTRKFDYLNAA